MLYEGKKAKLFLVCVCVFLFGVFGVVVLCFLLFWDGSVLLFLLLFCCVGFFFFDIHLLGLMFLFAFGIWVY